MYTVLLIFLMQDRVSTLKTAPDITDRLKTFQGHFKWSYIGLNTHIGIVL